LNAADPAGLQPPTPFGPPAKQLVSIDQSNNLFDQSANIAMTNITNKINKNKNMKVTTHSQTNN